MKEKQKTIAVEPVISEFEFRHKSLKERAAEYGGNLNLSDEIDWDEPVGNEVW